MLLIFFLTLFFSLNFLKYICVTFVWNKIYIVSSSAFMFKKLYFEARGIFIYVLLTFKKNTSRRLVG